MPRRPEFHFDGTYYRKRIKLQDGTWKDIRGKTKEETRAKIQAVREAEKLGLVLDDRTTVAELAAEWYNNRKNRWSYSRQSDYVISINTTSSCGDVPSLQFHADKSRYCT